MKKYALILTTALALFPGYALAHEENLHFAHPLVTESPTPDTKVRLDYIWQRVPGHHEDDGKSDIATAQMTAEYAFDRFIGMELSVPYTWRDPEHADEEDTDRLDNIGFALKYANDSFADKGVIVGGGIEFSLPTGNDDEHIGSDRETEVAPFLDFGYRRGVFQLIGFAEFGFPHNSDHADFEIGWDVAALWSATANLDLMMEVDGEKIFGGEEGDSHAVSATPGVAYTLPGYEHIRIGAGASFPVTDDKEFYIRPLVSLFYHF